MKVPRPPPPSDQLRLLLLANVSSLIELLRLSGSSELVHQLWAQFTLSAVRVNVDVTWSRDEVLVCIYVCSVYSTWPVWINWLAVLVYHPEWDVPPDFVSLHQLGKVAWELQRGI